MVAVTMKALVFTSKPVLALKRPIEHDVLAFAAWASFWSQWKRRIF